MKISANARSAIRKAISAHDDWDRLRRNRDYNLGTMDRDALLEACSYLHIDVPVIVRNADDDSNIAPVPAISQWKLDRAKQAFAEPVEPSQLPDANPFDTKTDWRTAGQLLRQPSVPVTIDNEPKLEPATAHDPDARVPGWQSKSDKPELDPAVLTHAQTTDLEKLGHVTPWSDKELTRFDSILALVNEDAKFSTLYRHAIDATTLAHAFHSKWQEEINNATAQAPKSLSVLAASSSFIPPTWSHRFEDYLACHRTIALTGPAGNGKTTGGRRLPEAAGWTVYEYDCTDASMGQDIIGRNTITECNGASVINWVPGPLAKAFADPKGALLLNEYDALDPKVGLCLQSALEAGHTRRVTCPDTGEQLESVGPCPIILTMNTIGHGASVQYQGRNALDGANRDRVEIIVTGYEHEEEIIVAHGHTLETARRLYVWAQQARLALVTINSMEILSCRRLLTAAALMDHRDKSLRDATELAFTCRMPEFEQTQFRSHVA